MRALITKVLDFLLFPLSQRQLSYLSNRIAAHQGKGWYEVSISQEIRACSALLDQPPCVLVDIGGNRGEYTQAFLCNYPDSDVYIFEPSSSNIRHLVQLFGGKNNVHIVGKALSDNPGLFTLYADKPGSGLASLGKRRLDHVGIEMNFEEEVEVMRFDDYWRNASSHPPIIDFVKIDVEGFELSVLKGFGTLLFSVKLFQFEFGGTDIDSKTFFKDFWYFFDDRGFVLYRISPKGPLLVDSYSEQDEYFVYTNYIAVNSKYVVNKYFTP